MARPRAIKGQPPGSVVKAALNETNPGWLEHADRINRYNRSYDVYRGVVHEGSKQPWQTRLYVKYGMQVIDQLLANLVQGSPKAICKPRRQEDQLAARAMEMLLTYYADSDHLAEKEQVVTAQALIYGVSPAKTHWLYREEKIRDTFGTEINVVTADRPSFTPWNVYDCWWDPYARDVDCASYVVLRDWLTKEELEKRRYNEEDGSGTYKNLDLLYSAGPGEPSPMAAQNRLINQPVNPYKDRFEILEIWRDNRLTVIGNRQVLLSDSTNPYWMPGKPIVISCSRPDLFKIEGISETELVDHLQQALHMVTNLRMDNLKFTVNRGASYREGGVLDPDRLVIRPHYLWPVTDHEDVKFHDPPNLPREAYQEEETLLGRLQYITGISPYVTGASSTGSGVDQNTATGVSLLHESASRLLAFKANQIRLKTWQRAFEQWSHLTKQFLTQPQAVQIQGPGNTITWVEVGPQQVIGDYDVRIQAGEESLSRQQERAEAIALLNALAPFAQMGQINIQPLLERVAYAYDMPDRASLLPPPAQQAPPAAPMNGQQTPQAPAPFSLGGGITPQPAQAVLNGNAR